MEPKTLVARRFEILDTAGAGGMGTVHRALDHQTGACVALKVLRRTLADDVERFELEAQLLAELRHSAIVTYVAHGETDDGAPFLAMEWLDGESLGQRLGRAPLTTPESVWVARRVAEGLGEAHRRGIAHRDVKPGNIFLVDGDPKRAKVLDFGIARRWNDISHVTATGIRVGTLSYMSPEHALGDVEVDARADVFSLGAVLFECLTGRKAFSGRHMTAVLAKILLEESPRLRELRPEVPRSLEALVSRMLSKRREDRPPDASRVAAELEALGEVVALASAAPPPLSSAPALGLAERRFVAVVLARGVRDDATQVMSTEATRRSSDETSLLEAIGAAGGAVEFLADGTLVASIAGTRAATDLAARAAQTALAIVQALPAGSVSVASGLGVVSSRAPIGDVIDRAVEMLGRVPAGTIHLDDATAGLVAERFEVDVSAGGLVLSGARRAIEGLRTLLGKATPCVGRRRELALLEATFDEAVSERVARVVLVTGPAGAGKSRVRYELIERLREQAEAFTLLFGRADSLSAGAPFAILGDALRRAAGIVGGEPGERVHARLTARVTSALGEGAADARLTAELLSEVVGVPVDDAHSSPELRALRRDPALLGDHVRRAVARWLEGEARVAPTLLVLEDLHWGDGATIACLDAALWAWVDAPLMLLALARPEVHEQHPRLWSERNATEVRLSPLTPRASEELVHAALPGAQPAEVRRVVERAAGNAFFLEELIRALSEGRADELPETVIGTVQARLGALDADTRRVLRAASVFGGRFWVGGVMSLLGAADDATLVDDRMLGIEQLELVTRRAESRFPDEPEYAFRHALVREGAYAMLTQQDREVGHRLAAEWLEHVGESDALTLAEHFVRGKLPARAATAYLRATQHALEGHDFDQTVELAEKAVACGASALERGVARCAAAEARRWQARSRESLSLAEDALGHLEPGSPLFYRALREAMLGAGNTGQGALIPKFALLAIDTPHQPDARDERLVCLCRSGFLLMQHGHSEHFAASWARLDELCAEIGELPHHLAGWVEWALAHKLRKRGDVSESLDAILRSVDRFHAAGDERMFASQGLNAAHMLELVGELETADSLFQRGVAAAERLGLSQVRAFALHNWGHLRFLQGDAEAGIRMQEEALEFARRHGVPFLEAATLFYLSKMQRARGEHALAVAHAESAVAVASGMLLRLYGLSMLSSALLAKGDVRAAVGPAREAIGLLDELGNLDEQESEVRVGAAEVFLAAGLDDEAREQIRVARERVLASAAVMSAARRDQFLTRVRSNVRALAMARELLRDEGE